MKFMILLPGAADTEAGVMPSLGCWQRWASSSPAGPWMAGPILAPLGARAGAVYISAWG